MVYNDHLQIAAVPIGLSQYLRNIIHLEDIPIGLLCASPV